MRSGVNPQKLKSEKNRLKYHRVIVPVHIPNLEEDYYREALTVLKSCLHSLLQTINSETTDVTIINNSSCIETTNFLRQLLKEGSVNKLVEYKENMGKVYAVLNEARASYESFLTVADADVLFLKGWEKAVFDLFKEYKKAGVISPVPSQSLALYKNCSLFFDLYFSGQIKYDKIVKDEDCDLFLKGLGNPLLLTRKNAPFSWKEKQYFLKRSIKAVVGANHYVATYRREALVNNCQFPHKKFTKGYEEKYLDEPVDRLGWYRLSTPQTFAYHLGNRLEENIKLSAPYGENILEPSLFSTLSPAGPSLFPYALKKAYFKMLRKVKQL